MESIKKIDLNQADLIYISDLHAVMQSIHGKRYVEYRRNWDRASGLSCTPEFPLNIEFEQNTLCNYRCNMCILTDERYRRKMNRPHLMGRDVFEKIIEEGGRFGLPAVTFGYLSEPLLSKDITNLIRFAGDCGVMDIRMGTNGSLLHHFLDEELMKSGLSRLEISLDALTPEAYGAIRKGGNFDQVKKNILSFLELRNKLKAAVPFLRLSFLKKEENVHELEAFLEYWSGHADYFSIQTLVDYGRFFEIDFATVGKRTKNYRCPQPFQRIAVLSNGDVLPCCSTYASKLVMGNAATSSIHEIWHSGRFRALREMHAAGEYDKNPYCYHCIENTAF